MTTTAMDTNNNNNNNNIKAGVISFVGSSPVSMYSDNSNSQPCFPCSSSSSSSSSAGEDGSSSAGGSPRGRDDGGVLRASPSQSVASLTKLNGMVLLCKVCGDVASGFHYGVHACEGCKGFFRRSIQQNLQYKVCVRSSSCSVQRTNRNRCQQCRFRKCLSVGMSRDAVRFGRIPKREKQRMLAEMQSAMNNLVNNELQSDFQLASLSSCSSSSSSSCSSSSSSPSSCSSSSPCPGVTMAPQPPPSALPLAPSSPSAPAPSSSSSSSCSSTPPPLLLPPCQSPCSSPPSPPPSPGMDSTISAIARAHRETFLYAHDKLQQNNHARRGEAEPNRCPSGYHANGLNTIYHHNNNLGNRMHQHHHGSGRRDLRRSNVIGSDDHVTRSRPVKRGGGVPACPMNVQPHADASKTPQQIWEDFSLSFTPAVREVVEFARHIPGFSALSHSDQVTLLKAGTFEVLMVRFASLFNVAEQTVTFVSGATYSVAELRAMGMDELLGNMFDFSQQLAALQLSAQELGLFTAVVLVSADRSGIEDVASVEQLQENLIRALRSLVSTPPAAADQLNLDSPRFTKLLLKLPDLRTLNNLHSEKLLSFHIDA